MIYKLMLLAFADANPIPEQQAESETFNGNNPISTPIINGESATRDDFPMTGGMLMTGIIFDSPMETFVCSSTLIAPDVVLLAAHCLDDYAFTFGFGEIEDKKIYWTSQADLSSWNGMTTNPELPSDSIEASDWVIHEDFDMQNFDVGLAANKDIALLFLNQPILDIEPAYLPTATEGTSMQEGDLLYIVGWGQQSATSWGEQPPEGSYAYKQQGESHIAEINTYEFKVGEEQTDVRKCHGDSGGPSFWEAGEGLRLVGVTSHAYDDSDCFETGGVDTRVDYYLNWINDEMTTRCTNGTRVWCEEPGILPYGYFQEDEELEEDENKTGIFGCSNASANYTPIWALPLFGLIGIRRRD
jgi:hypothetical protein